MAFKEINRRSLRWFVRLVSPETESDFESLFKLFKLALTIVIAVGILTISVATFSSSQNFGQWGDLFGGLANPLLTFLTFMGLLMTIVIQQKELRETRAEMKRSSDALTEQVNGQRKQNFEATFFNMLQIHNTIVNAIDLVDDAGRVTRGRDCFSVFYTRLTKIYREKRRHSANADDAQVLRMAYQEFWKTHQSELGHYFRYLYNVIRFLSESGLDANLYLRNVRAQLSDQELLVIFYNCISSNGANFTPLAVETELLDNMPKVRVLNRAHLAMIDSRAFGKRSLSPLFSAQGEVVAWLYAEHFLRLDGTNFAVRSAEHVFNPQGAHKGFFVDGCVRNSKGEIVAVAATNALGLPVPNEGLPEAPHPTVSPVASVPLESRAKLTRVDTWGNKFW